MAPQGLPLDMLTRCQNFPHSMGSGTEPGKQQQFDPSCLHFPSKLGRMLMGRTPAPGASIQTPGLAYLFTRLRLWKPR